MALLKDPAQLAYDMGNTPKMVFKHYRKVVTGIEAVRWFGIYPDADGKPTFVIPDQIQAAPLSVAA